MIRIFIYLTHILVQLCFRERDIVFVSSTVLQVGFSENEVEIREGESSLLYVSIISPDMVAVMVAVDVILDEEGTANGKKYSQILCQ